MTQEISIHPSKVHIDLEDDIVHIEGAALIDILSNYPAEDVLDELDFDRIHNYVIRKLNEQD